ncbi:MAG TPA: hypothetical protein VJL84_11690 [Kiloniellales bacterium]|nr:hypothetical protein [Kiloniellales bacterium]
MNAAPHSPWFRPKSYGYGATPSTWQGWALVLGYVAAVVVLGMLTFGQEHTAPWIWAVFVAVVTVLTLGLLTISRRRTDGDWRWRWGNEQTQMKVKR